MKKIKNIFTIVVMLVLTASCDDAVNIIQDGELPDEVTFEVEADLDKYLKGAVYSSLDASSEITFTSIFTDELSVGISSGGQGLGLHRFFLNKSDGYAADIWLTHYTAINRVNRLLRGAEDIPETDKSKSTLAEARVLRAYCYLQLLSYFSTDMTDDSALGVILSDHVPVLGEKLPRVTNGEIFDFIISDLVYGEANLTKPVEGKEAYKFVSKNLINAIYARMYLYRENYPLAKQYAQTVVSTSGLSLTLGRKVVPDPAPATTSTTSFPYRQMWADNADNGQGEIIFALSRPLEGSWGNIAGSFYFNTTNATGGAFFEMGRNLFNLLNVNPDSRRTDFVDITVIEDFTYATNPDYINSDVLPINKYPGKGTQSLRNDLKIFRLSEMYFILAECAVVEGNLPAAAGYIRDIKVARNNKDAAVPALSYASPQIAWAGILDERRMELCYEGFRYLDIKRLGVLAGKSIDRHPTDDKIKSLPTTISNTDDRFTLPIPQNEISANPTIVQNPGY